MASTFESNKFRRIPSQGACASNVKSGDSVTYESGASLIINSGATVTTGVGITGPISTTSLITTRLLVAADSGKTFFLNLAAGFTVTLPAVTTAGLNFTFIVGTAPTTAYILLSATNDNIIGYPIVSLGSDETANGNTAADQINFVANVALPSDRVSLISDGTSWHAVATAKATGAITFTG